MRHLRRNVRLAVAITLAGFLVLHPIRPASADAAGDKALAQQLFKDAKTLMNAGNYKDACPKFEASAKLDPGADGTILNLGLCFEGLGRLATAWAYYNETIARAKKSPNPGREQMARDRLAAIEPKLSYVTIRVSTDARVVGLVVAWDGQPLDEAVWNTAVPVDAGTHHLAVSAPNYATWTTDVEVGSSADKKTVDVPKLVTAPAASGGTKAAPPPKAAIDEQPPISPPSSHHTASWIAFGAAGVFAAASVGTFILAKGAQNDRRDFCAVQTTPTCPDDDTLSRMHRWETISLISGGVALVAIGTGIVLWNTAGPPRSTGAAPSMRVVAAPGAVFLRGEF